MKNTTLLLALLMLAPVMAFAQKQKQIESSITKVTVFMTGAQVTREAKTTLEEGSTTLVFKGLSHLIDQSTISLNAGSDVMVMAIKHRLDFLAEKKDEPRIAKLKDSIEHIDNKIEELIVQFQILRQKENYLVSNRKMETGSAHFDPVKFKELNEFYGTQFSAITKSKHALNASYKSLMKRKLKFVNELRSQEDPKADETSTVEVLVKTSKKVSVDLTMIYSVEGAGWTPSYDIRVNELDQPLSVIYKANVAQNTGEDWTNVELTFSNSDPERNNTLPQLTRYTLGYVSPQAYNNRTNEMYEIARQNMSMIKEKKIQGRVLDSETGLPLPYATISVDNIKVAVTDEKGDFNVEVSENVKNIKVAYIGYSDVHHSLVNGENIIYLTSNALNAFKELQKREADYDGWDDMEESLISFNGTRTDGYSANYSVVGNARLHSYQSNRRSRSIGFFGKGDVQMASPIENNISLEFKMEEKYTIKSNGKPEVLEMTNMSVPAQFEYYAVPKVEEAAFLMAHVVNWSQYKLLPGETNLYLGNTYIGKSDMDVYYVSDTLNISLGRDPSVTVKREKVREFSGRQLLGSDNVDKRQFRISVMNNKSTEINIVILDQVPLSNNKQISVEVGGLSGATYNPETGGVRKKMTIKPGKIEEMEIKYTVKYPKGQTVNLE